MKSKPVLRCKLSELRELAERYQEENKDEKDLYVYRRAIMDRSCLIKDELGEVARWKSPRSAGHIEKNSDEYVQEITGISLTAKTERTRVEVLNLLDGVEWPTASVILHFFHGDPYPILDRRALWSISVEEPNQYSFVFWWDYVCFCRKIAEESRLDMRTLDQALWQYSKENQVPG